MSWSEEEDALLLALVADESCSRGLRPRVRWSEVSRHFQGRSGKSLRERYVEQIRPSLSKAPWTADEDVSIVLFLRERGSKWAALAKQMPHRSPNAVKNHWNTSLKNAVEKYRSMLRRHGPHHPIDKRVAGALAPEVIKLLEHERFQKISPQPEAGFQLSRPALSKAPWSEDEDVAIVRFQRVVGNQWAILANRMQHRSAVALERRWYALKKPVAKYIACLKRLGSSCSGVKGTEELAPEVKLLLADKDFQKIPERDAESGEGPEDDLLRSAVLKRISDASRRQIGEVQKSASHRQKSATSVISAAPENEKVSNKRGTKRSSGLNDVKRRVSAKSSRLQAAGTETCVQAPRKLIDDTKSDKTAVSGNKVASFWLTEGDPHLGAQWSAPEDAALVEGWLEHGETWYAIAGHPVLKNRSEAQVKSRWNCFLKSKCVAFRFKMRYYGAGHANKAHERRLSPEVRAVLSQNGDCDTGSKEILQPIKVERTNLMLVHVSDGKPRCTPSPANSSKKEQQVSQDSPRSLLTLATPVKSCGRQQGDPGVTAGEPKADCNSAQDMVLSETESQHSRRSHKFAAPVKKGFGGEQQGDYFGFLDRYSHLALSL